MDLMKKYKTRLLSMQENIVNGICRDLDATRMFQGEIAKRCEFALSAQGKIIDFHEACKKWQRGRSASSVKGGR